MLYIQKLKSIIGLSIELAKAEFKLRNEGSYLGILWYLLNPILTFALLFLVFSDRLGGDIPRYPLYLLLGIITFNFFQSTTLESTKALTNNHFLIKSVSFRRESLVIAVVFKNLFSHLSEIIIFIIALVFFKVSLVGMLYYFPILLLFLFFISGCSLILSLLTVYFADLENIWTFAVRIIWFGTPIFYSIAGQAKLLYLNLFNPLYYFITVSRDIIVYNQKPETFIILGTLGFTALSLIVGMVIFNRLKGRIAELI